MILDRFHANGQGISREDARETEVRCPPPPDVRDLIFSCPTMSLLPSLVATVAPCIDPLTALCALDAVAFEPGR